MSEAEKILRKHLEIDKVTNGFLLMVYNTRKQRLLDAMEEYKNKTL